MDILDSVFPLDPENDGVAEEPTVSPGSRAISRNFDVDALRESEVVERALMFRELHGGDTLQDPATGIELVIEERNGGQVYVSPDVPGFGFQYVSEEPS